MIATANDQAFVARAPGFFDDVVGDTPRLSLLAEVDAHEGPVYIAEENALYFTTGPQPRPDGSPRRRCRREGHSED